jgi:hypothetical protein
MEKTLIIDGEKFTVNAPYSEGHICTAAEARTLNQTRAENIGNNFRKSVKEKKAKGESLASLIDEIRQYDAEYSFASGRGGPRVAVDPVEREARKIAIEAITAKLKEQGRKFKDWYAEKGEESAETKIDDIANRDATLKLAKKRVALKKSSVEAAEDFQVD